jgi:AAA domain
MTETVDEILDRVLGKGKWRKATADNHVSGKAWNDGLITARDLQSKTFKPVRIILSGLIPEGVTLLAGKPKVGKSWLALDVCLAVADETRFVLGDMRPVHGAVLYLALEDNERRLKKRIDKIVQSGAWPERLEIHTEWKRIDQGGLEDIEAWIKSAIEKGIEPRLIWIDTLAKIRPIAGRSEQAYAADYRAIDGVQRLAGQYGVGVVFNTHLRKAPSEDDPFDEVSGTLGLTAAADTTIVMKRHSGMVKVYVRGRDIEEAEFAAEFNRNTCRWRIVGGAEDVFRSQERQAIIAALRDAKDRDGNRAPLSVSEIMAATERTDRHPVDQMLSKMRKAGEVVVAGRGLYTLPDPDPLNPGEIDEKAAPDGADEAEAIDSATVSATDKSHRKSHRDLTGTESGEIAGEIAETPKPLTDNGQSSVSHRLTDLTGIEHGVTEDLPSFLDRTKGKGPHTWGRPRIVTPDRRPPLGPPGDSLDDFK